jgi:hypothetical protein
MPIKDQSGCDPDDDDDSGEPDYQAIRDDELELLRLFPPFEGWSTPPP